MKLVLTVLLGLMVSGAAQAGCFADIEKVALQDVRKYEKLGLDSRDFNTLIEEVVSRIRSDAVICQQDDQADFDQDMINTLIGKIRSNKK